jgi:hypothetical protein
MEKGTLDSLAESLADKVAELVYEKLKDRFGPSEAGGGRRIKITDLVMKACHGSRLFPDIDISASLFKHMVDTGDSLDGFLDRLSIYKSGDVKKALKGEYMFSLAMDGMLKETVGHDARYFGYAVGPYLPDDYKAPDTIKLRRIPIIVGPGEVAVSKGKGYGISMRRRLAELLVKHRVCMEEFISTVMDITGTSYKCVTESLRGGRPLSVGLEEALSGFLGVKFSDLGYRASPPVGEPSSILVDKDGVKWTMRDVAIKLGMSDAAVRVAARVDRTKMFSAKTRIAGFLGRKVEDIWPEDGGMVKVV